jgi:hypothetical protein
MADRIELAERFVNAFNERRYAPRDLQDYVAENVVVQVPATGQEFHGLEGVEQFNQGWADTFTRAKVHIVQTIDKGDYVETQFRGKGAFDGVFVTPQGAVKGDGSHQVDVLFTNRAWIQGNKITRTELHFDGNELLRQMGLA